MNNVGGRRPIWLAGPRSGSFRGAARVLTQLVLILIAESSVVMAADEPAAGQGAGGIPTRITLRSSHFALRTDLPRPEAEETLSRMEASLKQAVRYWRREPRGQIACYVVDDLNHWPDSALPHPLARVWVGGVGGATISEFTNVQGKIRVKATVYALARPGIAEHEVIHAYCYQTFGEGGPDWYKEGMAQLVSLHAADAARVGCPEELVRVLDKSSPNRIRDLLQEGRFTRDISHAFGALLANRSDPHRHVPMSDWTGQNAETLRLAERHYVRSWALCHMLLCNPNYAARFRALGDSFLTKGRDSFDTAFASVSEEMAFEYAFFLDHVDVGYRVDLCRWDWQKRFFTLDEQELVSVRIEAARGFQASGLKLQAGHRYGYATTGSWGTSAERPATDASGDLHGSGRMVGAVMSKYQLDEPFELGQQGEFVAATSGNLYLRCRDAWNQLHDNQGTIHVRFAPPSKRGR